MITIIVIVVAFVTLLSLYLFAGKGSIGEYQQYVASPITTTNQSAIRSGQDLLSASADLDTTNTGQSDQ